MKVLIVDDELDVLQGLIHIIDWENLGFTICGTASNGTDAFQKIQIFKPDLVLLDIRMPGMNGIEIIRQCQDTTCKSHFIILSGYSDFHYAQDALKLGADNYLIKPVDENELTASVRKTALSIQEARHKAQTFHQYKEKARDAIILGLITGQSKPSEYDLADLNLMADQYMVVLYERYNQNFSQEYWSFADLMRVSNQNNSSYDTLTINDQKIMLLKGTASIHRFCHILEYYSQGTQKGSPLDSIFLIYGRPVQYPNEIPLSYQDATQLLHRRFFCEESQHTLCYKELPARELLSSHVTELEKYPSVLAGYIQSHNRSMLAQTLMELEKLLYFSNDSIINLKHSLIDAFLQVKQIITQTFPQIDIPFPGGATLIDYVMNKYYLYEIIQFFSEQFEMCIKAIGNSSSENIMDDILYYIEHNFSQNLKLESIAPLFGYNSSYLGKLFTQKAGENFNTYLDKVRIEKAKELLLDKQYRIYEISDLTGYKNPDYFYKKFKKYVGMTPAEYRKNPWQ